MFRNHHTIAFILVAGVVSAAAASAQNATSTRAAKPHMATASRQAKSPASTVMTHDRPNQAAVRELDAARLDLVRLDERSMSHDAREALAPLTDEFHALYRSYAGVDVDKIGEGRRAAEYNDNLTRPRGVWKNYYMEADRTLNRILGTSQEAMANLSGKPSTSRAANQEGSSQQSTMKKRASSGIAGIPLPARNDFMAMRTHLNAFYKAAGGANSPSAD